ncbi:MAG: hypothetical protein PHD05_00115 [Sphaerochaetaceae bacterium]|jgi:hypothetical protein|nr:hypothetical protein [Sphaerochaetaceae bacterium]
MKQIIAITGLLNPVIENNIIKNLTLTNPQSNIGFLHYPKLDENFDSNTKDYDTDLYFLNLFSINMNRELSLITNKFDIVFIPYSIINLLAFASIHNRRELVFNQLRFIKYYIKNYTQIYFSPSNNSTNEFENSMHERILELYSPLGLTLKQIPEYLLK